VIENLPEVANRPGSSRYKVLPNIGPISRRQAPNVVQSSSSRNISESPRQTDIVSYKDNTQSIKQSKYSQPNVKVDLTKVIGNPIKGEQSKVKVDQVNANQAMFMGDQLKKDQSNMKINQVKNDQVKVKADQVKGDKTAANQAQTPTIMKRSPNSLHKTTSGSTKPSTQSSMLKAVPPATSLPRSSIAKPSGLGVQPQKFKPLTRRPQLPKEPDIPEKDRVALAIKLPTGQRVQRFFRLTDRLSTVMKFAEISARLDFTGWEFVCTDPRLVLSDLSVTIERSELPNKTLLYVQYPD